MTDSPAQETDNAGVTILPPHVFGATLVLALLLSWALPWQALDASISRAFGLILVASGAGILFLCWKLFTTQGTNIPPNKPVRMLIQSGAYRFSRNPMYLSLLLIFAGLGLLLGSGWIFLFLLPNFIYIRFFVILREEAYLERRFGDAYLAYCRRVGRWL